MTEPDPSVIGAEIIAGLFLMAVIAGTLTFVLLRAASKRADAMVTISLSTLTLVAIVGFAVSQSETLGAIGATGVGALAGALTQLFKIEQGEQSDGNNTV